MSLCGSVWTFTDSQDWQEGPGGDRAIILESIEQLIERHGNVIQFVVNDCGREFDLFSTDIQLVVAPGNPAIERSLSTLGLECVGYYPLPGQLAERSVTFLGEPQEGGSQRRLKSALVRGLKQIVEVEFAYLTKADYGIDDRIRLVLCIQAPETRDLAQRIGSLCWSVLEESCTIDLIFYGALAETSQRQLKAVCSPFFRR